MLKRVLSKIDELTGINHNKKRIASTNPLGISQNIKLKLSSGGTVELILDVNLFVLDAEDSKFVRGLIDKFREYRDGER